jgi:hypothetical protein
VLTGELQFSLGLLVGEFAEVLVDDVADMLKVDRERYDLHGALDHLATGINAVHLED